MPSSMELRRAADALLRCQTSPLRALLNPSSLSRCQAGKPLRYKLAVFRPSHHAFTTGTYNLAPRTPITSATPSRPASAPLSFRDPPSTTTPTVNPDEVAHKLGWTTSSYGARARPSSLANPSQLNHGGDSADDILSFLNRAQEEKQEKFDPGRLKLGQRTTGTVNDALATMENALQKDYLGVPKDKIKLRLRPSTGREIAVHGSVDIGRAFRLMEQLCARNRVRADFTKQRFHERPGLKRKRLARERWRKQFMEAFKSTVGKVKRLHQQGW